MTKLIQDCLTELKNNEEARNRFNKTFPLYQIRIAYGKVYFWYSLKTYNENDLRSFRELDIIVQTIIIQKLLSTINGKSIMHFLDFVPKGRIFFLDKLLYDEYVEALRVGKPLEEALEIINKIYIENILND